MKVVINIKDFLNEKSKKESMPKVPVTKVAENFGLTRVTLQNWERKAPESVEALFRIVKENKEADIEKALIKWQKPSAVLMFLRDFIKEYNCKFTDIVKEVKP